MSQFRNRLMSAALLLIGVGLGMVVASLVATDLKLKSAEKNLQQYADRALLRMETIPAEARTAGNAVRNDKLPFCSDEELTLMRRLVFNSLDLKDLGRDRDGKLYCTTGLGRLPVPLPISAPDVDDRGEHFYALAPLAIAPGARGLVVEADGISVALNPEAFETSYDEPPKVFTGMFFARSSQRAYFAFGHAEPLSNSEVIAAQLVEHSGIFYQPLCSKTWRVCIVAAEPRAAMMVTEGLYNTLPAVGGALMGGFLALTVLLFLRRQRSLARRLRRAIRRGELSVVYQPVVDLETREVTGAEALARWQDESSEMVPPDLFIEAAEKGGFIQEITELVLDRVVEEIDDLLRLGNFRVTINITMQDLTSPSFFEHIYECMKASKIKPGTLGFELTERSTGDREMAQDAIAHLKSLGHPVYIDDFGTGYSSLAYLHDLAADAIKIDRAFTATVGTQAVTASVVPQILDMASQLDLMVVVEGIETEQQAEYFKAAGRGIMGQGWLFGRPVSAEQLKRQIAVAVA